MAKSVTNKAGENAAQALSQFKYDEESGLLVRGQVIHLRGYENDRLLVTMDYMRPVAEGTPLVQCAECGALFLDDAARERHGQHFHDHWCSCGYVPPPLPADRDAEMQRHMRSCRIWRREFEEARERHTEIARKRQQDQAVAISA